ncbi:SSI family serine proteinase inhibitor [Streptomyces sp. NPDC050355]|uniref:SSI family serine proteinase inhibitor n=1 Tax=Streptomyces sp. NPDC050355 TaxID=3365609 RepID=UPI0037BC3241
MPVRRRHRRHTSARAALPAAVLATVSAALAGTFLPTPAGAAEPPPPAAAEPKPPAVAGPKPAAADQGLLLTVSGDGNTWIRGVRLGCPDTYGRHPHALAACNALTWARGDFDALPGEPHGCTKQFAPVTVSARGTFRGAAVDWHQEFANLCTMDSATGPVFRF